MRPGTTIVVDVERPAVGGRMIARHEGRIVFVAGAIPGERVEARVERVQRQAGWAETTRVLTASPDRVEVPAGLSCGGQVLAHVAEPRQRALKADMLADALRRIGRIPLDTPIAMHGGPADGYRTRARIHLRDRRAGFFQEGSHHLCDLAASRQLTPATVEAIACLTAALVSAAPGLEAELEWAEDVLGSMRAVHVTVASGRDAGAVTALSPVAGVDGMSCSVVGESRDGGRQVWGVTHVVDHVRAGGSGTIAIAHAARAFFQGNRYLLQPLVDDVVSRLDGPVLDLYAGVGIFAVTAAAAGHRVTAIEGDPVSAADLLKNTAGRRGVVAVHGSVEGHLAGPRAEVGTVVMDPPRTGLSPAALAGVLAWAPARIVYASCDAATLARDLRCCLDAGYRLTAIRGVDLFPRTGHVEAIVTLER
jgi:23S rRNA (uracil1939-C5)-methyltransferase